MPLLFSIRSIGWLKRFNIMIRIGERLIDITMKVELELSQPRILDFLAKKGYKVEAYHLELEAQEEMLVSEPRISEWTFTATKGDEKPSEENIYIKVFKREIKALLNSI